MKLYKIKTRGILDGDRVIKKRYLAVDDTSDVMALVLAFCECRYEYFLGIWELSDDVITITELKSIVNKCE